MQKKYILLGLACLLSFSLRAELTQKTLSAFYQQSEQVSIPTTIREHLLMECTTKKIPTERIPKYEVHLRVLLNPAISVSDKIEVAEHILQNAANYADQFPTETIKQILNNLSTENKK
jgi:hypothetical protein